MRLACDISVIVEILNIEVFPEASNFHNIGLNCCRIWWSFEHDLLELLECGERTSYFILEVVTPKAAEQEVDTYLGVLLTCRDFLIRLHLIISICKPLLNISFLITHGSRFFIYQKINFIHPGFLEVPWACWPVRCWRPYWTRDCAPWEETREARRSCCGSCSDSHGGSTKNRWVFLRVWSLGSVIGKSCGRRGGSEAESTIEAQSPSRCSLINFITSIEVADRIIVTVMK